MTLGQMKRGQSARIVAVGGVGPGGDASYDEITRRLLEMGLLEGAQVEVVHEAPFGGDPMAVRVRGALVALRRQEANLIQVAVAP